MVGKLFVALLIVIIVFFYLKYISKWILLDGGYGLETIESAQRKYYHLASKGIRCKLKSSSSFSNNKNSSIGMGAGMRLNLQLLVHRDDLKKAETELLELESSELRTS